MSNGSFSVHRETTIDSDPRKVYAELIDFRRWENWSPWEGLDPDLKRTYTGPESGVGSKYSWTGNRKVGSGSMEVSATEDERSVTIRLEFLKPFKATNTVQISLSPVDDHNHTRVSWTMTGRKTVMTKFMGIFWPMDKVVGGDFERGLAQLKAVVEG